MTVFAAHSLALALCAVPPWQASAFTANPVALAAAAGGLQVSKGVEVDVLREETDLRFDEAGRFTRRVRLVYVPRTAAGAAAWAESSAAWLPSSEARPELRVRVISPGGRVRWLDPATAVDGAAEQRGAQIYSDERVLRAPLPGIEAGVVVEEEITVRETVPFFAAGLATRLLASRALPVRSVGFHVEAPTSLPLRVQAWGLPTPKESVRDGRRVVDLELEDLPARPVVEPWAPAAMARPRYLAVSTGRSWGAVAAAYAESAERQLQGADLGPVARQLLSRGDSPEVAGQKVLDWMAGKVRYTGLSLGDSGLVPARPAETLERGFGDCKDLSLLAVAVLRASGRKAQLALLRTGRDELDPGQFGVGAFDHAVVRIEATPPVWLDPAGGALAGHLGQDAQGRLALLVDRSTTALVSTPADGPADNRIVQRRRIELAASGWAHSREEVRYAGLPAVYARRYYSTTSAEEADATDRDRLALLADGHVQRTFTPGVGREEARLQLVADASRWGTTGNDQAEAVVTARQVFRYLPDFFRTSPVGQGLAEEKPPVRREGMELPYAHEVELRYEVVPPPGFRAMPLPPVDGFAVGSARFSADLAVDGAGAAVVTYHFEIGRTLQPGEVVRLWQEVAARTREDGPRVRFERTSQALLREGKDVAALGELRRLAALEPLAAAPRNRLALALVSLGMGDAARAEARRAVALEPGQEWAARVLGYVLMHDLLGRAWTTGADLAGAEAAFRQARAVLPRSPTPRGMLARVLLRSPGGALVGPGPRLEEALSELKVVREELSDHSYDDDYLQALFTAGRIKEALATARSMPAGARRNAILTACAMLQGTDALLQVVRGIEEQDRAAAGQAAFFELVRTRHYQALASILGAMRVRGALDGGSAAGVEIFERMRRQEAVSLDRKDPASLPGLLFQALAARDPAAALAPLLRGKEAIDLGEVQELATSGVATLGKEAEGMEFEVMVDIFLSVGKVRVEGDGPPWRVAMEVPANGKADTSPFVLYAVRQDGLPRVALAMPTREQLAELAWQLDRGGDQAGARRILGWALQGLHAATPGDPSFGGVASALWPGDAKATTQDVRRTAAALAAFTRGAPGAYPALDLEPLRQQATGPARIALSYAALMETPASAPERLLALSDELLGAGPAMVDAVWWRRAHALRRLGRAPEGVAAAEARLKADPSDRIALRTIAVIAMRTGDALAFRAAAARLLALPGATADDWNDVAWYRLAWEDPPPASALEEARKAVTLTKRPDASTLHTLATIEAFGGRPPADAVATLRRALKVRDGKVQPADWLVLGRVAEAYGLPEAATACYRRVTPATAEDLASPGELAARRLKGLTAHFTATSNAPVQRAPSPGPPAR